MAEKKSLVQPLESVDTVDEEALDCWNCDGKLDSKEVCKKCGFDRKLVYNLDLEVQKTKEREQNETNS